MITNQMRMELLTLGWSKDEIKYLTPKECWKIIGRGVPKKPSREGLGAISMKTLV